MTHWGSVLALISTLGAVRPAMAQVDVKWAMHLDHEEVTRMAHAWAEAYPNLVSLQSLGKSPKHPSTPQKLAKGSELEIPISSSEPLPREFRSQETGWWWRLRRSIH